MKVRGFASQVDLATVTTTLTPPARPFLKWAGGKTSLLPTLLARIPLNTHVKRGTYFEPFVGGGALFFALAQDPRFLFRRWVLNDANTDLWAAWRALRGQPEAVIECLKKHKNTRTHFEKVRAEKPEETFLANDAARTIYLNKTCFNGLYRVNRKGEFNVPFGDYKNPKICDEENLRAVGRVLDGADPAITNEDFENVVMNATEGDVVYFDPPYLPISETSDFTSYTATRFGLNDHERLRDCARRLKSRGVFVLISNSSAARKLYTSPEFYVEEIEGARSIAADKTKRKAARDLLIR